MIAQAGDWMAAREQLRGDPVTGGLLRRLAKGWRALTGGSGVRDDVGTTHNQAGDSHLGRRTLLACSGGGDSSALVLGLCAGVAKARERFVVGHVVHDLRSSEESLTDRDRARDLAAWVGVEFVEAKVRVREDSHGAVGVDEDTNHESRARRARYRVLAKLARAQGCGFVATAHHADDAMETVLMRLLRGSAGVGLGGIHHTRGIGHDVVLVRPMLWGDGLTRVDSEQVCAVAGFAFALDKTNADETRLRAYLRARVLPALRGVRSDAATRITSAGRLLAEAGRVVRARGSQLAALGVKTRNDDVADQAIVFDRPGLAGEERIVLGEVVRAVHTRLAKETGFGSVRGHDRLNARVLGEVGDRIKDESMHARTMAVGHMAVTVTSRQVRFAMRQAGTGKAKAQSE